MSMSTIIIGFVPPDEDWKKMKAVYDSCKVAGMDPPEEVWKFFNYDSPTDAGAEIDITHAVSEYNVDSGSGFDVDISKLPSHVKTIRFVNVW